MRKIFIVDTETTSLNPDIREAWDIAWQVYNPDTDEVESRGQFFNKVNVAMADPMSLAMNHFYERYPASPARGGAYFPTSPGKWRKLWRDSQGCTFAGIVPSFDEHTLRRHMLQNDVMPAWHYKIVDVVTWAAGVLGMLEPDTEAVAKALGVPDVAEDIRHTAAGDVQLTVDILRAAIRRAGR